jgi:hypothetical protein
MYVKNEADNSRLPRSFNDLASAALTAALESLFLPGYPDDSLDCLQSFSDGHDHDFALSFALLSVG